MRRAIVTGATGTIGIALVKELLNNNIEVLALVNPSSNRLNRLPKNEKLIVKAYSINQLNEFNIEQMEKYDAFFHLAWQGTIGPQRDEMKLQLQNVQNTLDAVILAERLGCEVFIGAGSQAEYGRVEGTITADTKTNPEMGYGIAKLCAGQMSRLECKKRGIRHVWTRILSVYGPNDGELTMIISAIRKMLRGEIPDFSKGEQKWDYLYCEDAARALYLAGEKGVDQSIYPIGSGVAAPLKDYIEIMRKSIGEEAKVNVGAFPYREKQVMYLCADIEQLTKDTGFVPNISFEEGIKRTIKWCKQS